MCGRGWMLILVLCASGCGGGPEAEPPAPPPASGPSPITGTLNYRERISLSPQAQVEVRLLDVSIADMPATTLGIARIDDPGLPPIDFRLEFNPQNIDERKSYVVRAEIREGDRLIFTTDTAYPVLTRGAGNSTALMLVAVGHAPEPPAPLFDTHWKLISIEGQPVVTKAPPEDAHLALSEDDNRATGYTGCNRFFGDFLRDGERAELQPLASTRQACVDTMQLEKEYLAALAQAERFEIVEQELRLRAASDAVLLTFVAMDSGVL